MGVGAVVTRCTPGASATAAAAVGAGASAVTTAAVGAVADGDTAAAATAAAVRVEGESGAMAVPARRAGDIVMASARTVRSAWAAVSGTTASGAVAVLTQAVPATAAAGGTCGRRTRRQRRRQAPRQQVCGACLRTGHLGEAQACKAVRPRDRWSC